MSIEAMKLALEALEYLPEMQGVEEAITALRQAISEAEGRRIEQAEQAQPFGYVSEHNCEGPYKYQFHLKTEGIYTDNCKSITKVYTAPPPRQPLTDEQRVDLLTKFEPHKNKWEALAILIDMVEAAHGIKEKSLAEYHLKT